jgi:hypothetical protein
MESGKSKPVHSALRRSLSTLVVVVLLVTSAWATYPAMMRHMSIDYRRPVALEGDLIFAGWSSAIPASSTAAQPKCVPRTAPCSPR